MQDASFPLTPRMAGLLQRIQRAQRTPLHTQAPVQARAAYAAAAAHRGHRHALHATRLLRPLALGHGFTELWISTTPDNAAARRTLELLGAQSIDTVAIPPHSDMQKLGITIVRRYRWTL